MYCKSCGNKIEDGSNFCSKCGTRNKVSKGPAIASLVIGILSLFLGVIFLPLPVIGLILGLSQTERCAEKTAGVILNTISLVFSVIVIVLAIVFGISFGPKLIDTVFEKGLDKFSYDQIQLELSKDWGNYSEYVDSNDELDNTNNIVGNWKELSDKKSYLVFEENKYYFYDDVNNLEDKYLTGTYSITDGFEELKKINVKNEKYKVLMDKIMDSLKGAGFLIIKLDTIETHENGVVTDTKTTEENSEYIALIFEHDNIVELVLAGHSNNDERRFYKVKK